MLPPIAQKKMQQWIRSRHLICSDNFFVFESVNSKAVERFETCIESLGGKLLTVKATKKIWMGTHRALLLYQAKGTLDNPHHELKQYWYRHGSRSTRFDPEP